MTVLDVIGSRSEVYSIREDATVHDAARYLRDRQIRAAGVVDAAGALTGVVSQSDISDKSPPRTSARRGCVSAR
jgi:CBS domain-containing protein